MCPGRLRRPHRRRRRPGRVRCRECAPWRGSRGGLRRAVPPGAGRSRHVDPSRRGRGGRRRSGVHRPQPRKGRGVHGDRARGARGVAGLAAALAALPEPNPRRRPAGTRRVRVMNMVVPHRRVTGSERDRGLTDTDYAENVRVFDMWERWAYDGSSAWRDMAQEWFGSLGDEQVAVEIRRRPDRGRRTHGNRGRVRSRTAPDARVRQTHRSLLTLPDESERHATATEAQPRPAAIAARTSGS